MYLDKDLYIYVFTILTILLLVPIIVYAIRPSLFRKWSWTELLKTLNKALIPQLLVGVGLGVGSKIIDTQVYGNQTDQSNTFTDIFMGLTYCYIVIGLFFYLPSVVLLNLFNFLTRKIMIRN
jgi:hypothetical protein